MSIKIFLLLKVITLKNTIEYLNLSDCKINDAFGKNIGIGLKENTALKQLILSSNLIEDVGGNAIGEALSTNLRLKDLDLSSNHFGDKGMEGFFSSIIANQVLESINLSNNSLTDTAAQRLHNSVIQNHSIKKLKLATNPIATKYLNDIEIVMRRNFLKAEHERRAGVVSQFTHLTNEVQKTEIIKKESENVLREKKKLKKEIFKDLDSLNEAQANKDKGTEDLQLQLQELFLQEKKMDIEMKEVDLEIMETEKRMKREFNKKMRKLNEFMEGTLPLERSVENLRKQFKDAEFQHRVEIGEIKEALQNFKAKEEMWAEIVHTNEAELAELRGDSFSSEEQEAAEAKPDSVLPKKQAKRKKKKIHRKPPQRKFFRECKKCQMIREARELAGVLTPRGTSNREKPLRLPVKKISEKCVLNHPLVFGPHWHPY